MPKSSKKSVKRKLGEPTVLETDAKAANTETEHVDSGATGSEGAAAHHEQEEVGEGTENNAGPGHYMTKVLPSNNEGKGHEGQAKDRRVTPPPLPGDRYCPRYCSPLHPHVQSEARTQIYDGANRDNDSV